MRAFLFSAALVAAGPSLACTQHAQAAPVILAQAGGHAHGHGHAAAPTTAPAGAATAEVGPLRVSGAYARAAVASGGASAAYMTIATGAGPDRLLAAASPAAARVELHAHTLDAEGVARMRQVPAIEIAPDHPAELKPGGLHVMLMGLTDRLAAGDRLEITLTFEQAGEVTLSLPVIAPRAGG